MPREVNVGTRCHVEVGDTGNGCQDAGLCEVSGEYRHV